jgi:ubiquinone/menaquinone biosynthesis C-methylase UbiE
VRVGCSQPVREYDLIAEWYAREGRREAGVREALDLVGALPAGARVLDLGCGNGIPITSVVVAAGCRPIGVDSSSEMLARFLVNCVGTPAVRAVAQRLPFRDDPFEAVVCWGMLFHLPQADQCQAVAEASRVLCSGGVFLFTSGNVDDDSGTHVTPMNGVDFHYYSYSAEGYRRILAERGIDLLNLTVDAGQNTYYSARKRP